LIEKKPKQTEHKQYLQGTTPNCSPHLSPGQRGVLVWREWGGAIIRGEQLQRGHSPVVLGEGEWLVCWDWWGMLGPAPCFSKQQ